MRDWREAVFYLFALTVGVAIGASTMGVYKNIQHGREIRKMTQDVREIGELARQGNELNDKIIDALIQELRTEKARRLAGEPVL